MSTGDICYTTIFAVLTAQLGSTDEKEEKAAIEALRKKGVEVEYAAPLKQVWLAPEAGKPDVGKPLRVWFHGKWQANAEDLEYLRKLPSVYGVTFGSEDIAQDWLRVLEKTPQLKEVILTGPSFTDASTRYLTNLKDLDSLSLTLTRVTDKGLAHISHLKNLEFLSVIGNDRITDKSFRALEVKNLRFLNLDGTSVTGAGIASLKNASKLEWLALSGKSANAGLKHLKGLKNLQRLRIGNMDGTEAEMKEILDQSQKLEKIETIHGDFTRKGWENKR